VWARTRAERLSQLPPFLLEIGPIPERSGIWHLIQAGWLSPASILERAVDGLMECTFTYRHEEEAAAMTQQLVLRQDATIADLKALLQSRSGDCLLGYKEDTPVKDLGWLEGSHVHLMLKVLAWGLQANQERYSGIFRPESLRFYLRTPVGGQSSGPTSSARGDRTYEVGQQTSLSNFEVGEKILREAQAGGIALLIVPAQFKYFYDLYAFPTFFCGARARALLSDFAVLASVDCLSRWLRWLAGRVLLQSDSEVVWAPWRNAETRYRKQPEAPFLLNSLLPSTDTQACAQSIDRAEESWEAKLKRSTDAEASWILKALEAYEKDKKEKERDQKLQRACKDLLAWDQRCRCLLLDELLHKLLTPNCDD
jgi:hypothetical protein